MNVLILGNWSTNKGDRAIVTFLVRELFKRGVSDVCVSASVPSYWTKRKYFDDDSIRFVPFGCDIFDHRFSRLRVISRIFAKLKFIFYIDIVYPFLRNASLSGDGMMFLKYLGHPKFIRALNNADLVICTGGHHLTSMRDKDAVSPLLYDMLLSLLHNKPLILWSQTIGPLVFSDSKNMKCISLVISSALSVYLRDEASFDELDLLELNRCNAIRTYDSVFGMYDIVNTMPPSKREKILGISVFTGLPRSAEQIKSYVDAFVIIIRVLDSEGFRVRFFPMELSGDDLSVISAIQDVCDIGEKSEVVDPGIPVEEHMRMVSECRFYIGHKTHSIVFSLATCTPVIAIAYHKKSLEFMMDFGLEEYVVQDKDLSGSALVEKYLLIKDGLDVLYEHMFRRAAELGACVQTDFTRAIVNDIKNV